MPNIQIMDSNLSNQIAAGEVVERPASVVKELCENAIDAKSNIIEVHIEDGGLNKIKVIDNGSGMSREDAILAFERHATSKLKSERDLSRIQTLGFRGEALPSISAVSKVRLQTWDGAEEAGTTLEVEEGSIRQTADAPLRQGTVIEVSDLFYNTPARYKYLKTIHTELSHITDFVNRLALAHPSIAFTLRHNGRTIFKTSGNGRRIGVIASIYGLNTTKQMIPFSATHIDFDMEGYLGKPECSRSNRSHISVFINGRYIKHYPLTQAIIRAYQTLLPVHRYPIVVLAVNTDPTLLDVNVHPSKLEIRLSKEKEMIEWIEDELQRTLQQQQLIPQPLAEMNRKKERSPRQASFDFRLPQQGQDFTDEKHSRDDQQTEHQQTELQQTGHQQTEHKQFHHQLARQNQKVRENTLHFSIEKALQSPLSEDSLPESNRTEINQPEEKQQRKGATEAAERLPLLFPMAQLHGTYILAQNENGLYLIDQHAAQERIWYERYIRQLDQPEKTSQELGLPFVFEFTPAEDHLIQEHVQLIEKTGLILEPFGHHAYRVRSHPSWFPAGEEESLVREIIGFITERKKEMDWSTLRDDVAKLMSCKQAIKANRYLTLKEMEALLEELRQTANPFTCPHGRPITVLLTKYEIEKMFKRVM